MNATPAQLLGASLLVVLGAWAGYSTYSHRRQESADVVAAAVRATHAPPSKDPGEWLPGMVPVAKVPDRLPQFTLGDLSGKPVPVSIWAGHPLVINFWATWCAPCRREIPLLNALSLESTAGTKFVGIAVDHREKVREFADKFSIKYPLVVGEQEALDVAALFGMSPPVFPFTVFTDRKGEIVALFVGELHRPQADLILAAVSKLDEQGLTLAEAQHQISDELNKLSAKTS